MADVLSPSIVTGRAAVVFQYVRYLGERGVLVSPICLLPSADAPTSPHLPAPFTCRCWPGNSSLPCAAWLRTRRSLKTAHMPPIPERGSLLLGNVLDSQVTPSQMWSHLFTPTCLVPPSGCVAQHVTSLKPSFLQGRCVKDVPRPRV